MNIFLRNYGFKQYPNYNLNLLKIFFKLIDFLGKLIVEVIDLKHCYSTCQPIFTYTLDRSHLYEGCTHPFEM